MRFKVLLCFGLLTAVLAGCSSDTDGSEQTSSAPSSMTSTTSVGEELDATYTNNEKGYAIRYPRDWTVRENDALQTNNGELLGTSFVVPAADFAGTKAIEVRAHVAVEDKCPKLQNPKPIMLEKILFLQGTWSDAGAGNRYTGEVYTNMRGARCFVFTFFTHLCNLGPDCGTNMSEEFNASSYKKTFREMVASFTVTSPSSSARSR